MSAVPFVTIDTLELIEDLDYGFTTFRNDPVFGSKIDAIEGIIHSLRQGCNENDFMKVAILFRKAIGTLCMYQSDVEKGVDLTRAQRISSYWIQKARYEYALYCVRSLKHRIDE
jgi:hypothetical protein